MLPEKRVEDREMCHIEQNCWTIVKTCKQYECVEKVVGLTEEIKPDEVGDKLEELLKSNELEYIRNGNNFEVEDKEIILTEECGYNFDYENTSYLFVNRGGI